LLRHDQEPLRAEPERVALDRAEDLSRLEACRGQHPNHVSREVDALRREIPLGLPVFGELEDVLDARGWGIHSGFPDQAITGHFPFLARLEPRVDALRRLAEVEGKAPSRLQGR